jgi:hypothetical protein
VGDDLRLISDAAVQSFGVNSDVTLTHVHDAGLLLNSTRQLQFNDASQFIEGTSGTVLSLGATDEIDLTATAIDVNGTMDVSGAFTNGSTIVSTGAITADAGVEVDNITIDGTEIDLSSGDLTVDVAGDIILDAGGAEVLFHVATTAMGHVSMANSDLTIKSLVSDRDMIFQGNDGGSAITALTLDMSDAGTATFNSTVTTTGLVIGSTAVTSTAAEINLLDGSTVGSVVASKALVYGSSGEVAATTLAVSSTSAFTGAITSDAGVEVDNITIDGTEIDLSSGDLTVDVAGDIILDAAGDDIILQDGGTQFGKITNASTHVTIYDGTTLNTTMSGANIAIAGTVTTTGLVIGSTAVTASAADINLIDGITNGTVIASKAIITDSALDIEGGRNITISGELIAATLDISGAVDVAGAFTGTTIDASTDFTIGTLIVTDDQIQMTPSSADVVTIAGATNGILNITTVDDAGTAGDINLTADGQIEYRANDAAGHIFDIAGTNQLSITDGVIAPVTNNDIALGTSALSFSDLFLADGSVLNLNNGDVTLTHAAGKVTLGGDGAVEIDFNDHEMTNVDINSGAIDGTTIGAASASTGSFTTLAASGVTTFSDKIIINSSAEDGGNGVAIPLTNHATFIQTGGAETSTLGAGTEGQIKVIVMEAAAGDMVTTVTNAAWGGSSIITFDAVGDAVTLQYIDSKWYCIGNNGAVFG